MSNPAGWYPQADGQQRYWDGQQWTEDFAGARPVEETVEGTVNTPKPRDPNISRRVVVVGGLAAVVVGAVGALVFPKGPRAATGAQLPGGLVNIVAHSDDDLLFINPDIQAAIRQRLTTRTIIMTCDEWNGAPGLSRLQLAARLREGQRRAYASMAQVASNWKTEALSVGGKTVELNTLLTAPYVQLVYPNLPDGGDNLSPNALQNLYSNSGYTVKTLIPTGSPVPVQTYTKSAVDSVLTGLLAMFKPTVIRTQDPFPDPRFVEHTDHVATARFVQNAASAYGGPAAGRAALLVRYRCYDIAYSTADVPPTLASVKTAAYREYNVLDPLTGGGADYALTRCYQRFPTSSQWVLLDGTKTLHAFVVGAVGLLLWRQADGGSWTGPTVVRAGMFAPGVATVLLPDGKIQIAVLDLARGAIMTSVQAAAGGSFDAWLNVGNPNGSKPAYGTPVMVLNAEGGIEMYARNGTGGLSNCWQQGAGFHSWVSVPGGSNVMNQPVAIRGSNGKLHVFCDGNGKTLHWTQPPNGSTTFDSRFYGAESTAPPAVTLDSAGKVRMVNREQNDGALGTLVEKTVGGIWSAYTSTAAHEGIGTPSVVSSGGADPGVLVFARNNNYGVSMSKLTSTGAYGPWQDMGGYCELGPAAVRDASGVVRLLAIGADGGLHERHQTAAGPDAVFNDWLLVGL
jgi:hypothetical protein